MLFLLKTINKIHFFRIKLSIILGTFSFLLPNIVFADLIIAVVGKTKNDSFYQQSFKGCEKFASTQKELRCIYDGANDYQDIRKQNIVVKNLINKGIDGLLISITDSEILSSDALKILKQKNIPVITFDSDVMPEHAQYRLTYVGTDNYNFGQALGNYVKKFANEAPNYLCLQTGHSTTPNLNERIAGVRYALSGQSKQRLTGENGWIEDERCPLYSLGKREKALNQLTYILNKNKPPIVLAVAGFAQFNPRYLNQIDKFKERIASGEIVIVSADTESNQLMALKQGLSVANLGQKPFEMGQLGAELLFNYLNNKQLPSQDVYYLDYHHCTPENVDNCTVNY